MYFKTLYKILKLVFQLSRWRDIALEHIILIFLFLIPFFQKKKKEYFLRK